MTSGPDDTAPLPGLAEPSGRPGDPDWYTRRFELVLYVLAGVSYVVLGVFHKWLLNWVVGPIWLVTWIWAVPILVDRV
ncbi:MAG: hypothetical protein ACO1PW_03725, partial [Actinomycetota bacterium]